MKKKILLGLLLVSSISFVSACKDNKDMSSSQPSDTKQEENATQSKELKYNQSGSSLVQYEIKGEQVEIVYDLEIVNNTEKTKYFYLYADMAKEDDNLVKEDIIPACEKKAEQKQIYKLDANEGEDDYFMVYFKGTHGIQELKETKDALQEENLIIEEIDEKDIPKDAYVMTLDDSE